MGRGKSLGSLKSFLSFTSQLSWASILCFSPSEVPWAHLKSGCSLMAVFFFLLFSLSVMSDSLQPHGLQHARLPCPSLSPGVCSNSCPLSQWCHPTILFCHPCLLLPGIRVFSNELSFCIRWPKYWSFSFSISPSNEYLGLISLRIDLFSVQFGSVQLLSCVRLFVTPWTEAHQASLSIINSRSLLKLMSIELVMPSNLLILCRPLLLLPSIFPSIRVFSNVSVLCIRWPKYWSFSFSISPSKEHPGLISFRMDWLDLLAVQGTLKSLLQHHSSKASILRCSAFFGVQLSDPCMTTVGWSISC